MDVTLTYAVPVHVVDLGANLRVYIDTLPVINALRLCNRFGRGEKADITKLPIEVMAVVESFVVLPARESVRRVWASELSCFEQECDAIDHFSREQRLEMFERHAADDSSDEGDGPPSDHKVDMVVEDVLSRSDEPLGLDCHMDRRIDWSSRIGYNKVGFFGENQQLFTKHFGLNTWLSHVRLPAAEYGFSGDYEPTETTVAYLIMPNSRERSERWSLSELERDNMAGGCYSGFGLPVILGEHPSRQSLRRFGRAMQILDLKVFVHESQEGPILASPTVPLRDVESDLAYAAGSWPQLTLLSRSGPTID